MERHFLTFTIGETTLAIPLERVESVLDGNDGEGVQEPFAGRIIDLPARLGMKVRPDGRKPVIVARLSESGPEERVAFVVDSVRTLVTASEDQIVPLRAPAETHLFAAADSVLRIAETLVIVLDFQRLAAAEA